MSELVHRRRSASRKWRSPCMQMQPSRKKTHHNWVWVPAVPSWEKEFCYKIGSFRWEDFLQLKKLTEFTPKVLDWDDSDAKDAFDRAKNRFFAQINNLSGHDDDGESIPGPDSYIDAIDWDHDEEIGNVFPGGSKSDDDEEEDEADVPDYYHVRMEDIKPTGWDVDVEEFAPGKVLTGFIIGR